MASMVPNSSLCHPNSTGQNIGFVRLKPNYTTLSSQLPNGLGGTSGIAWKVWSMTSRKRKNSSTFFSQASKSGRSKSSRATKASVKQKRQHILETLESRQLLAGPQLIGIQPNDGELIVDGTVRDSAPRVLTLRFDADQVIDASTLDGVRITRSGQDGVFGSPDDVQIVPGLVTLGDPDQNEVVVRFAERLPDDNYRVEVFGFDDDGLDIVGLRNQNGELLQPSEPGARAEVVDFRLGLGALVESIVPQPVVRQDDGSLVQNRDEIVVYFNEDPLFVEDDSAEGRFGNGTEEVLLTGDVDGSFDNVRVNFVSNTNAGPATATFDQVDRSIEVVHRPGNRFSDIVEVLDALDGINAELVAGDETVDFAAPAIGTVTEIKGNPTIRSAENPRFYQLLLTNDTVRTTDDELYAPKEVIYDPSTFTARLFFDGDINELANVPLGGGTFRLRIGTAVDDRVDLILPPTPVAVAPNVVNDFGIPGMRVTLRSRVIGEGAAGRGVRFEDTGSNNLSARFDTDGRSIVFDFGGDTPTFAELIAVAENTPGVRDVIEIETELDGAPGGGSLEVPQRMVDRPALILEAVGDTLGTALDVGIFGRNNELSSLVFSESIDPQTFLIEPLGGNDDPGHIQVPDGAGTDRQHINDRFGPDTQDGITEIAYNFNGIFDSDNSGNDFLNQITERQKLRVREALNLWANYIGVQFRETEDEGITFALGNVNDLQNEVGSDTSINFSLDAAVRVDPTFTNSAVVFSNQVNFGTAYGEDFTRKATTAIGLILGLEETPDLPAQTLLSQSGAFLNADIDVLTDLEPVFPGNYDVLHGNYLHRADSIDVDLYRFEVNLGDADKVGTLTAETFAERLPDSSLLDTTLTLFEQVQASVRTDFGVGTSLEVEITAFAEGRLGNNSRIDFIQSERGPGDTEVRINRQVDSVGNFIENAITIDMPRRGVNISEVPVGDVVDAINNDPFASSLFRAEITTGDASIDVSGGGLSYSPLLLRGGGVVQVSRNDDYFSEDSRIIARLGAGVYYIGVAASGNDHYDPTIEKSGNGGRSQGRYDLHLKFEPQADEVDVIRDLDSDRVDVPGTPIDGDGDGTPGGVNNFWFQTRPLNRLMSFTDSGEAITPGQTVTIISGNGVTRTYEFVPLGSTSRPGNIPVNYSDGSNGFPTPSFGLAQALAAAVNQRQGETGVSLLPTPGTSNVSFIGERTIEVSADFRGAEIFGRNIFVDKTAGPLADGSLDHPFNNISNPVVANAFDATLEGDIVRIVGNGGADGDITTEIDNFSYQIGLADTGGAVLEDGRMMEVPKGVTTMIDAGAVLKLRAARIVAGSSTVQVDRSNSVLQILGAPRLVQLSTGDAPVKTTLLGDDNVFSPGYDDGRVILTSVRDRDVDFAAAGNSIPAASGDWGGIVYRRDVDQAQGRRDLEDEGIFLQRVNHAELRYGGSSNIVADAIQQLINPIQIVNLRPTITFNEITQSADAAISAAPNSFEETSFQEPRFQQGGSFTADYDRVGPEMHNNLVLDNSVNGVMIRVATTPTSPPRPFTVAARFDDTELVHYVPENLAVEGKPGGSINDGFAPSVGLVSGRVLRGGQLANGTYLYKMTFVDNDGFESRASDDVFTITTIDNTSVEMIGLPVVDPNTDYVSRRIYRAMDTGGALEFVLVADLDASSIGFIDNGSSSDGVLDLSRQGIRGRLDASLVADPGLVMKFRGSRIELGQGTQFLAEGLTSDPVVFTSSLDDRFGAGGTFDTNNDRDLFNGNLPPSLGDWSGIYAGPTAVVSFDNAVVAYGGGISNIEGGLSRGFLPLELHQAEARVTNSRFEFNDSGQQGAGPEGRFGRLAVTPATIFARGTDPIIVGNTFTNNRGTIIDIDSDSLHGDYRLDYGRQTGSNERFSELDDNRGPMVRFNRYEDNEVTGMEIRGGNLTTESVWDDTDIVHLLFDSVIVNNFHSSGGLRLISRPDESLVVKLSGPGGVAGQTPGTGLTARGDESDILDRVGGTVQLIGFPGAPVVLTSFRDDSVGAGLKPDGSQFTDNNGDGIGSRAEPNDWRSVFFDQYSNDYNADFILESELSTESAPGLNGTTVNAQELGFLAERITASDEKLRLGFEVEGYLAGSTDVDTYAFTGYAGTEVWIDVDRTLYTNDTVLEVLDAQGRVVARSDDSFAEVADSDQLVLLDPELQRTATPLQTRPDAVTSFGAGGLYEDFGSYNERDAGLHFTLPGNTGAQSPYFFRIRSRSVNPDDFQGGLTGGGYRFQIRLTEEQIFPGNIARYTDIRYANHGIHVRGLPSSSPLLGEAQENEELEPFFASNDAIEGSVAFPFQRAQGVGNLVENRANVISVGGALDSGFDVDFYSFDVDFAANGAVGTIPGGILGSGFTIGDGLTESVVFDIDYAAGLSRPDTNISVFYDEDGFYGGAEPRLVLLGQGANIAEDLTTPFGEDDESERLSNGSVSTQDPFIGPAALSEGTYYVAVTEDGRLPSELFENDLVRREPVNSVERLFEDRVDNSSTPSTADGPRFPELFSDAAIGASDFVVTGNRGAEPGHGKPEHFDGSSVDVPVNDGVFSEFAVPGIGFASNLDGLVWSLADDPLIGSDSIFGPENTSAVIPHVTINGSMARDPGDVFLISIPEDNTRVIIDVDAGFNPQQGIDDDDPDTPPFVPDPNSVDLRLRIADVTSLGNNFFVTPEINTSNVEDGRAGSLGGDGTVFNTVSLDPFVDTRLNTGIYMIYVVPPGTTPTIDNGVAQPPSNDTPPVTGSYVLHVSVEDHVVPAGAGNQSIHFNRQNFTNGTLTSEPFDLLGYSAADRPRFYFNYLLDSGLGDNVGYTVTSNENPVGQVFGGLQNDDAWLQEVVDLDAFAGHTNIQITFDYTSNGFGFGEGLYLDDFIVGFAERGETIFNARQGQNDFSGFGTQSGEYQLELRRGTQYNVDGVLTRDFDTNQRHSEEITIVAPAGDQVVDGDTFVLSDGTTRQIFEFTTDGFTAFNAAPVLFDPTDSAVQIAETIRRAINLSPTLDAEAASASGDATGPMEDARLNLFGIINGDFLQIESHELAPTGAPLATSPDGNVLISAVFDNLFGDVNHERPQSQIIIDSNTISDVNAIGIWTEPGTRDTDIRDLRDDPELTIRSDPFDPDSFPIQHQYLQLPPAGNTYPGAVRNLPTLNDSVQGGLAPGAVIVNNTIDQAQMAGIKVEGETRPLVIHGIEGYNTGNLVDDGALMVIDAAGTRVVFEFEDIQGDNGHGEIAGGDGYGDGHVPIYYRHCSNTPCTVYNGRGLPPSTSFELMYAIFEAIQGSILVTNDMVELVTPFMSIDPFQRNPSLEGFALNRGFADFPNPAVWLQGASAVYFAGRSPFQVNEAPVHEAPQPFARVVNNTIYGADGRESLDFEMADREDDDIIADAIDTKQGIAHRNSSSYVHTASIGDNSGPVSPENDVDFFKVELNVGDRLVADIDTVVGGVDTVLQIFNEFGEAQIAPVESGQVPGYLDPETTARDHRDNPVTDAANPADPYVDFFAPRKGTYYVAVSASGNDNYDPNSLSGRDGGEGGTGDYQLGIRVFAGRTAVIGIQGAGRDVGTVGADLVGAEITITQVSDVDPDVRNSVTFTFAPGAGNPPDIDQGTEYQIGISNGAEADRVPDIMRSLTDAINRSSLLNLNTAVNRVEAKALGGIDNDNPGLPNLSRTGGPPHVYRTFGVTDWQRGFGHDRLNIPTAPLTTTSGTSELYTFLRNVADVELNDAAAAMFYVGPDERDGNLSQESDQLITEQGVMIAGGASPTLVNNVIVNTHQSIVREETSINGFGRRFGPFTDHNDRLLRDNFPKPMEVIVSATVFKYDEHLNSAVQTNLDATPFSPGGDPSLVTDVLVSVSNVNGGDDDFNVILPSGEPLLENPAGDDFQPAAGSYVIDSATNSLIERDAFAALKNTVGIPVSNILAPNRDVGGVLRADNPLFATPGGLGSQVFKDRGSTELADFVGPVAIAETPRDNDAEGIDVDGAIGFINLSGGTYNEFRIQLRDNGDASDPFAGVGIDDTTVVIPEIPGLRPTGSTLTLFENDRLLTEGIDYVFNYDETKNTITLTPLTGIWQSDRSYRIALNNRDRNVLVAPDPSEVNDGDQIAITDTLGGTVVFEFESGYQLLVPEPITLVVPRVGTNGGGLSDGDIFQIDDGSNPIVVFEFNSDGTTLPGTVEVPLPSRPTPTDSGELDRFLNEIAVNVATAIQSQANLGLLDVDTRVEVLGDRVVVGAEPGTYAVTSGSGLQQLPRTLALQVPQMGIDPLTGIRDGDTFVVSNGTASVTFEFDTDASPGLNTATNVPVPVLTTDDAEIVALKIQGAIANSPLGLTPQVDGTNVFLNLPIDGDATVPGGQLRLVGLARTAVDGDTIQISPTGLGTDITLEVNRTDEPGPDGPMDDGVGDAHVPINITRLTTADELAGLIANQLQGQEIAGLDPNDVQVIPGGLLAVGGEQGLGFAVSGSSFEVTGSPDVTGASTIQVFGPLLLQLPLVGAQQINDGSVLILEDDNGNDVIFEFNNIATTPSVPGAFVVPFNTFDLVDVLADNLVTQINLANIGIPAVNQGNGRVSLGRISESRVDLGGIPDLVDPINSVPGVPQLTTRRGIVSDGEVLSIRQGTTTVSFEFESINNGGGVAPNNIAVAFQPGSTIGDVAISLAAAINNNRGALRISAEAELAPVLDADGNPVLDDDNNVVMEPTGQVLLDDLPGTVIDVTAAPTLNVVGVPGGAIPVRISPAFTATEVKRSLLNAFAAVNPPGEIPVTTLMAEDRGGATFFVENGEIFEGPLANYFLPGVKDLAGNLLEANRSDTTTQFTILMPTVELDYGDAPDPVLQVPGRYPTLAEHDGPRHVVDGELKLGHYVDADLDGQPVRSADGDDLTIDIVGSGGLFGTSVVPGAAEIKVHTPADIDGRDGDTVTINTNVDLATIEFDLDGRFDEDNFAVRPIDKESPSSIADAVVEAIVESPLRPAGLINGHRLLGVEAVDVQLSGVNTLLRVATFSNSKVFEISRGIETTAVEGGTFTISIDGAQATFEFDSNGVVADGNIPVSPIDPASRDSIADAMRVAIAGSPLAASGLSMDSVSVFVVADDEDGVNFISSVNPTGVLNKGVTTPIDVTVSGSGVLEAWIDFNADGDWDDPGEQIITAATPGAIFSDAGAAITRTFNVTVPATTPDPLSPTETYARFRVSRDGGLEPTGLALSGEVEDYTLLILPGSPPQIGQPNRAFTVEEDRVLQALDDGTFTVDNSNDDGLLTGVVDLDGDSIAIYPDDVGVRTLTTPSGVEAGTLEVFADGTFTFLPAPDFNSVDPATGEVEGVVFTARVTDIQPFDPGAQLVNSTPISVTIVVEPVNDPPVVVDSSPITRDILEDEQQVFHVDDQLVGGETVPGLIADRYVPGPANESHQPMIIQSVQSSGGAFVTEQGGTVAISDDGRSVIYTPPADFNNMVDPLNPLDSFTYTVADIPLQGQSEAAATVGTVIIDIAAQNDPPRLGNDTYSINEGEGLTIPLRLTEINNVLTPGILDNDFAGPQDEVDENPDIFLTGDLENIDDSISTFRNGTITRTAEGLVYESPLNFSGTDSFQYEVRDTQGAVSTATVTINIGGVNNGPMFVGVNGDSQVTSITRDEAKEDAQQDTYNLSTWFFDPEGDDLTYSVVSSDPDTVEARVVDDLLLLTYQPFQFSTTTITLRAEDPDGEAGVGAVTLNITNTPDPPTVIAPIQEITADEDSIITRDLSTVFEDKDITDDPLNSDVLTFTVSRLDNLFNPTAAQIAAHPVVDAISTDNGQLRITLKPDQSGSAEIEIAARDTAQFVVADTFTLNVTPVADRPEARPDGFNVPIGAALQVLNPSSGLLANDFDADGDDIEVVTDPASIVGPSLGDLEINADGTFIYTNTSGAVGGQDSFTYRVRDTTGRLSDPVTVTFDLNDSRYQNPIDGMETDVNADGRTTALDALRIINFLSRKLIFSNGTEVPVTEIGSPPPDFLDVNGNGKVSALDANNVITRLGQLNNVQIAQPEAIAGLAASSNFVTAGTPNLPVRNAEHVAVIEDPRDSLLTDGLVIQAQSGEQAVDALVVLDNESSSEPESIDEVLSSVLDEFDLDLGDLVE